DFLGDVGVAVPVSGTGAGIGRAVPGEAVEHVEDADAVDRDADSAELSDGVRARGGRRGQRKAVDPVLIAGEVHERRAVGVEPGAHDGTGEVGRLDVNVVARVANLLDVPERGGAVSTTVLAAGRDVGRPGGGRPGGDVVAADRFGI